MTVIDWLGSSTTVLSDVDIPSARLDCLILLEDATGKDRAWLLAHPEYELEDSLQSDLDAKLDRRARHEPLAYIRGKTEFYGREFFVDAHVLEPRPESEMMIEMLKELPLPDRPTIIDVGTGSGALAICALLEFPRAMVIGTDIDPECLRIAERNATSNGVDVSLLEADLLVMKELVGSLGGAKNTTVILANLPYVPDSYTINQAAMNEPRLAIFGGPDGLDQYRRLFEQINTFSATPAYILAESLPPQHPALAEIAAAAGYTLLQEQDFIQVFCQDSQSAPA